MSVIHADFTIERRYGCTPRQAFSAWADPALKRQWFANPGDWADCEWELDFRVGGEEIHRGGAPGTYRDFHARYHDIVDGERIVYAYDLRHDGRLLSVSLATIELEPAAGGGTRQVFTEHGVFLDGLGTVEEREHGSGKMLDALGRFLAGEPVR